MLGELLWQRCVEIGRDVNLAPRCSRDPTVGARPERHEFRNRATRFGERDLFSAQDPLNETRQMSLRFVNVDCAHLLKSRLTSRLTQAVGPSRRASSSISPVARATASARPPETPRAREAPPSATAVAPGCAGA